VIKLRETLKTLDQLTKRHENEVLRKKRLAFVGISLDNVLHKGEPQHAPKGSKASSQESNNGECHRYFSTDKYVYISVRRIFINAKY
jgi:remodeling and spacing factor 1